MKTFGAVVLVATLCLLAVVGCGGIAIVGSLNTEATMKNGIIAQEKVQVAAFDKLWKKIAQETQITSASSKVQRELVQELVSGRPGGFVRIVNESNPSSAFDREQFTRLANLVEGERDSFFREQKVLISKVEQYNNQFDTFPANMILNFFGRVRYPDPKIITSDKANDATESGVDNDVKLNL